MTEDFNPLLHIEGLPIFSALKPHHIYPAISQAVEHCRQTIIEITAQSQADPKPSWDSVIAPHWGGR